MFLKNKNVIFKIRRSKVTDYAALIALFNVGLVNVFYQSPLILTALFQHSLINVSYLTACCLYQVMMALHFLYDVANDVQSKQKSKITS